MTRPLTPAERQRLRTPANLWRALIPLILLVGLLVVVSWPRGTTSDGVHVVDLPAAVRAADSQAGFAVLAPSGLSSGWRPTSTEFVPAADSVGATFHVGWVTPRAKYAELLEGADAPDAVAAQYGPLAASGDQKIAGRTWQAFDRSDGHPLLRTRIGTVTVIVTGATTQTELTELAASIGR